MHKPTWLRLPTRPLYAVFLIALAALAAWGFWPRAVDVEVATVAMAPIAELGIPHAKVNVNGGACALGHPIGASGARILVTLIHALQARGLRKGVASLCIGGGEATAMAIELA